MNPNFLNPHDLASLKDLRLVAKSIVDEFLAGNNRSMRKGMGQEFSQYRSYQPGDDLRQLDWKMYARSDRYFIREAEADSNVVLTFILDASGSMAHQDGQLTKFHYARMIIAALAYLGHSQGDSLQLQILQENSSIYFPPANTRQGLDRLFIQLAATEPKGVFPSIHSLSPVFFKRRKKQITVVLTDLYQKESEILDYLHKNGIHGKDTLLLHVVSQNEMELGYEGSLEFVDLETGERVKAHSKSLKEPYKKQHASWLSTLERSLSSLGVPYYRVVSGIPLASVLREVLLSRSGL